MNDGVTNYEVDMANDGMVEIVLTVTAYVVDRAAAHQLAHQLVELVDAGLAGRYASPPTPTD